MSDPFRDRRFLVTGASRGIGRALSIALAARGAEVVLAARTTSQLDDLATERDDHRVREAGAAKLAHVAVFLEARYRRKPVDEPAVDAAALGKACRVGAVSQRMQQGEEPPIVGLVDGVAAKLPRGRRFLLQ